MPPLTVQAGTGEPICAEAPACPPAGAFDHVMLLALVACSDAGDGAGGSVHDLVVFAATQRFLLPRITGPAGYWIF